PTGKTIMLAGQGKRGVQRRAARLDGSLVEASGIAIQRGELVTLQVAGGQRGLKMVSPAVEDSPSTASRDTASGKPIAAPAPDQPGATAIPSEQLGRWRLAGEMCDGKCLSGAMRPGTGLAHKACANLCLIGGAAPVFVTAAPVAGSQFLLMGAADGGPLPDTMLDQTARLIELDGTLERRGDLLVFLIDPATAKLL
ncbi:MAG: hypothetical protein AAFO79_06230, partial [Pseudomonadota bacterium]